MGGMYPEDTAQVYAIAANLEGRSSGWMVHDAEALELAYLDAFMQTLWEWFKDPMATQRAETHI